MIEEMTSGQPRHRPSRSPLHNGRQNGDEQRQHYSPSMDPLRQSRSSCEENDQSINEMLRELNFCNDGRSPPPSFCSSDAAQLSESPRLAPYCRQDIESASRYGSSSSTNDPQSLQWNTNSGMYTRRQSPPLPPPPSQPSLISSPRPRTPFSSPLQGGKQSRSHHSPNFSSPSLKDPLYRGLNGQIGNSGHHPYRHNDATNNNIKYYSTATNRCYIGLRSKNLLVVLVASTILICIFNVSLQNFHLVTEYRHHEQKETRTDKGNKHEDLTNPSLQNYDTRLTKRRNEQQFTKIKSSAAPVSGNVPPLDQKVHQSENSFQLTEESKVDEEKRQSKLSFANPRGPDNSSLVVPVSPLIDYKLVGNFSKVETEGTMNVPRRILYVDTSLHHSFPVEAFHQGNDAGILRPTLLRVMNTYPSEYSDQTQLYPKYPSNDILRMQHFDRNENTVEGYGNCVPVNQEKGRDTTKVDSALDLPWQHNFHPTCNAFHEVDMFHRVTKHWSMSLDLFGLKGFWRHAWHLHDVDFLTGSYIKERVLQRLWYNPDRWESLGSKKVKKLKNSLLKRAGLESEPPGVVLKTLKYEHNYEAAFFETNRIDAVAMERLTPSPHVTNIYGFCGMSVITEYGEGDFKPLIDAAPPLEKLKYAIDVASGLAATHYMDGYDRNLTLVHNDLNPTNVMVSNGTIKLNDYNIGIFTTWHKKEQRMCRFHNRDFANAQWRAPEEQFVDDEPADEAHTEKIDIYALGNIFFRIIAEHDPWKEYKIDGRIYPEQRNEIAKRKRHFGDLPKYLDKPEIEISTDPSIVAIRNVMIRCFSLNPVDRPTAIEVEKELSDAYERIEKELERKTPLT